MTEKDKKAADVNGGKSSRDVVAGRFVSEERFPLIPTLPEESDEILEAKRLLRENGYYLFPAGKIKAWHIRMLAVFLRSVQVILYKCIEKARVKREEFCAKRADRMKENADEIARKKAAEAHREKVLAQELRLAELRVEEARLLAASKGNKDSENAASQVCTQAASESSATLSAEAGVDPNPVGTGNAGLCSFCHAELAANARFCRKCGTKVDKGTVG